MSPSPSLFFIASTRKSSVKKVEYALGTASVNKRTGPTASEKRTVLIAGVIAIVLIAAFIVGISLTMHSEQPTTGPTPPPIPSAVLPTPLTSLPSPSPMPKGLEVFNMSVSPLEAWPGQRVNVTVDASNSMTHDVSYSLPFYLNGQLAAYGQLQLAPHTSSKFTVSLNETILGGYKVVSAGQTAVFDVVPAGKYTLTVVFSHYGLTFNLDGVNLTSPYQGLVNAGEHTIVVPSTCKIDIPGWGLTSFVFSSWGDANTNTSKTIDVQAPTYLTATWIRLGSCPSLYVWNGTCYGYASEVSDGSGWLGYLEYFNRDGTMTFSYNNPWDYIKLDPTKIVAQNQVFNMKIAELQDEIFYLDSVKLVAIDHPIDTNVFSTTSTFLYNLTGQGTMYTVSKNPASPVSAVNGQGQKVLPQISKLDGITTNATRWSWNSLTLNLGDLAKAKEIKLVFAATINWPTTSAGGNNFMKYANQPGVMPSPPPFMEVKTANGTWIKVPDDRQFPLPDVTDNTFVVNLTGLFPTNDYELRINYYQDIRFDYIGVDTTPDQNIITHTVTPSSAVLSQAFSTETNATGAFTRYGDVTSLLQSADNKLVIGREGDEVSLQFPADLPPVPQGMVRDYFVVASCWFKGVGLPYVAFTVNPLPFQGMTSYPYPAHETYPYDADHQAYLQQYDTRIINP